MKFGSEVVLNVSADILASQGDAIAIDYLQAQAYGDVRFHAPPYFFVEVANALWNGALAHKGARDEIRAPLKVLVRTKLAIDADSELAAKALDFALEHRITVYDAAYAVLTLRCGATLVTADSGLAQAAGAAGVAATLIASEAS